MCYLWLVWLNHMSTVLHKIIRSNCHSCTFWLWLWKIIRLKSSLFRSLSSIIKYNLSVSFICYYSNVPIPARHTSSHPKIVEKIHRIEKWENLNQLTYLELNLPNNSATPGLDKSKVLLTENVPDMKAKVSSRWSNNQISLTELSSFGIHH